MARPQKNNVEYFPHYISDGKKMFYIEQKYGNDGYASWFKILETLAKTDNHWVNLNEETELMFLASKCRISEETLINLLNDLAKLDQINGEMWAVKIVWSDKFIDSISDAYAKRSNECLSIEGLRVHLQGLGILKGDVNPQSIVKKTKVDKKKEETPPPLFEDFLKYAIENKKNVNQSDVELKYKAWSEAGWKCGKPLRKISNWKTTLLNTLPYLKEEVEKKPTFTMNR